MKKIILILLCFGLVGCSSKVVTWDTLGKKTVTTRTQEDIYHEQQAKAWAGYYEALNNPPVIARIQNTDGTVITISSQIPPPSPVIQQHENQYIKPVADIIKFGIGGVVIDRGLRSVVRSVGDVIVDNAGDGTVMVDKSDSIASDSVTTVDTAADHSDNSNHSDNSDNSDNSDHSDNSYDETSDPVIVDPPDPIIVPPYIVRPEIVETEAP